MKPIAHPSQVEDFSADPSEDPESLSFTLTNDNGITLDANIDNDQWHDLLTPEFQSRMMAILGAAMAYEGHVDVEIAILFTGADQLAALNETHRQKTGTTDVLSFPADDDDFLGDIALAYEVMENQARDMGISTADHSLHLLLHGALHLSGHDHIDDEDAAVMEGLEIKILGEFGIANPYLLPQDSLAQQKDLS